MKSMSTNLNNEFGIKNFRDLSPSYKLNFR